MGILKQVLTTIGGIDFQINYIVFKVTESISSYSILLGRPWLFNGRVKEDWGKGTITIGKDKQKIVLPMYPTQYHGETQNEESEETSDDPYDSERETTNYITQERPLFKSLSPGEYFMSKNQIEDSEDEILAWENALVFNITSEVEVESKPEPLYITDSDEMNENLSYSYLPELQPPKSECVEMNLGTQEDSKTIQIYKNLNLKEYEECLQFFTKCKSAFAWTYKDLKGIPREVCQHCIILEPNTKPVRQRQYMMNLKYSLMVKEEIDKLLECGFIYPIPYSE